MCDGSASLDRRAAERRATARGTEDRRRGRPARAEAPSRRFVIWLSPAERDRLNDAARANRQRPGEFARDALVIAADDCLEELSVPVIP